jgi:hypothetical protein
MLWVWLVGIDGNNQKLQDSIPTDANNFEGKELTNSN